VQHVTTVTLVWLWSRHDLKSSVKPIVGVMLLLSSYKPFLMDILVQLMATGPWVSLFMRFIITLCLGATTLQVYAGLAYTIGID
ncbi:hypothetical protein LSTR_LSTR017275, partial [Laodelphax striatellus]